MQIGESLFESLTLKASTIKGELSQRWFDQALFKSRSPHIQDYILEARNTWLDCQRENLNVEQKAWILERLDNQLQALVLALYENKPPVHQSTHPRPARQAQSRGLSPDPAPLVFKTRERKPSFP